jgi:hypothetical protein
MTDVIEMIDDLRELQKLYAMNEICFMDFQEKLLKYESRFDTFERDMEQEFEATYADG